MTALLRRLARLLPVVSLAALAAPPVAAAPCFGTDQAYSGTLLPGHTDTIAVPIWVRGNATFQFVPASPFWDPLGQKVVMRVGGGQMTGTGSLAITLVQLAPGRYNVTLRGDYLGVDGMAFLPYHLYVSERNCQYF